MMPTDDKPADDQIAKDESALSEQTRKIAATSQPGLLAEFWEFLKYNKKWWLAPLLLALLLLGLLVVLSGAGLIPFVYPFG